MARPPKKKPVEPLPKGKKPKRGKPVPIEPPGPPDENLPLPGEIPLEEDEARFLEELIIDRNPAKAYWRAFPGVAYQTAQRRARELMQRPWVRAEYFAARKAQRLRCQAKADATIDEVAHIAFSDVLELYDPHTNNLLTPKKIPFETRRAISSMKVSRERRTTTTSGKSRTVITEQVISYTFWNKCDALQKLANHLGLNTAIPPLESLLAMFPPQVADQIREAMRPKTPIPPPPSTNGNGKHEPEPLGTEGAS